ncbi:hypothetical protein V8G54_006597 [Vigna mungo]|uniref:Uncharacterized protein n=1 Tax=Vigna mungo TaxID=3915 RepID=A0AAQ3P096_VIGMU
MLEVMITENVVEVGMSGCFFFYEEVLSSKLEKRILSGVMVCVSEAFFFLNWFSAIPKISNHLSVNPQRIPSLLVQNVPAENRFFPQYCRVPVASFQPKSLFIFSHKTNHFYSFIFPFFLKENKIFQTFLFS